MVNFYGKRVNHELNITMVMIIIITVSSLKFVQVKERTEMSFRHEILIKVGKSLKFFSLTTFSDFFFVSQNLKSNQWWCRINVWKYFRKKKFVWQKNGKLSWRIRPGSGRPRPGIPGPVWLIKLVTELLNYSYLLKLVDHYNRQTDRGRYTYLKINHLV